MPDVGAHRSRRSERVRRGRNAGRIDLLNRAGVLENARELRSEQDSFVVGQLDAREALEPQKIVRSEIGHARS